MSKHRFPVEDFMVLKNCPFCGNEPKHMKWMVVGCPSCKIELPLPLWQGRIDSVHEIDGKRWVRDGNRFTREQMHNKVERVCLRSDMMDVMSGDWLPTKADGYCLSACVWYHRYVVDVAGESKKCYVNVETEKGIGIIPVVNARPFNGGFLLRYSYAVDGPFMYCSSLVDIEENL